MICVAAGLSGAARLDTSDTGNVQGHWVSNADGATAGMYAKTGEGASVVFYKNANQPHNGADFAVTARNNEVVLQVVDDKGHVHFIPVTALLNLKDK